MTRLFVFADSEVASLAVDARGDLRLRFAAAQVREVDSGSFSGWRDGHVGGVELVAFGGAWPATGGACIGRLAEGRVLVDGRALASLPLPHAVEGTAELQLRFANGTTFTAAVTGMVLREGGDARFVESLAC